MIFKIFLSTAAVFLMAAFSFAQVKKPEPPPVKVPFEKSLQAVVVTASDWSTIHGTARLFERKSARADWKAAGESFPIVVGRNGLGASADTSFLTGPVQKKEGDGKAPAGLFPLTSTFGNNDLGLRLPFTILD